MESKAKHTQGEWKYNQTLITDFENKPIATTFINTRLRYIGSGEAEANAKLIAAAPELLEALNELLLWANIKDGSSFQYLRDKAQNAINKATQ